MDDGPTRRALAAWRAGLVGLAVALAAAGTLSADHLQLLGEHLPGCGPDSGCAALTRGPWGRLPGLDWPTAHVGLAVVAGLLVTWLAARGRVPAALRPVAALGGLVSIGLLGVMLAEDALCPWCLVVHAGNLLFVACTFRAAAPRGERRPGRRPLLAGGAVAVLVTAGLAVAQGARDDALAARRAERLARSTAEIVERAGRTAREGATGADAASEEAFTGRWVAGAPEAPLRIVLFADYQCDGCHLVEQEAAVLLDARDDLSLSVKHFPMGVDCQPELGRDVHPNACEAARAAEAAGLLGGNDGFWRLHDWLVERQGDFTRQQLVDALPGLGFEPGPFLEAMAGPVVGQRIQDDIAEGKGLGLAFVPMVFVNGVELKEVETPGALTGVVEALAAELARGVEPVHRRPPSARDKAVDDWRDEPRVELPADTVAWWRGAEAPAVDVVVWGDYGQDHSRDLDALLHTLVASADDVRYGFRQFPLDPGCNDLPALRSFPSGSCRLASLAEAAGRLGGRDAFWRVHRWLFEHPGAASDDALARAAADLGLPVEAWLAEAGSAAVEQALAEDIRAWRELSLTGVPSVFVNGRRVPRWRLAAEPEAPVLELVLEAARGGG